MFCTHCGKELFENARFCQSCGAPVAGAQPPQLVTPSVPVAETPVPDEQTLFEEERTLVQSYARVINAERLAWKAVGIVWMAISAFLLFVAVATFLTYGEEAAAQAQWQLGCAVAVFVWGFVNLRMAKKTRGLCALTYTDIRPVIDRYSGATPVVFAVVFNIVAMMRVIEMREKIQSKTAVLQRIVQRQQLSQEI